MVRIWTGADAATVLREPTRDDDKYSRGVVGLRTGSRDYPGAAVLGVEAAWRTGAGMVRYLGPSAARRLVLQRRPETVTRPGRVDAWVIGSGTDAAARSATESTALGELLDGPVPVVADAGALDLVGHGRAPLIVTPHAGELGRLRSRLGLPDAAGSSAAAQTAATLGAIVVLKGASTTIAAPDGWICVVHAETFRLATAGTGDVLAGVMGAVVAQRGTPPDDEALAAAAATAVWLHGHAALRATQDVDGGPITALDVARALPRAVAAALASPSSESDASAP